MIIELGLASETTKGSGLNAPEISAQGTICTPLRFSDVPNKVGC